MKPLGIVFGLLLLLATSFVTLAAANKSHHLASDLAEVTRGLSADQLKAVSGSVDLPSGTRLNAGALVGAIGGLAAFVLLIAMVAKKDSVKGLGGLTVACAALSAAIYPHVETGPADGAAPRLLAMVAIGLAAVGALCAMLAAKPRA